MLRPGHLYEYFRTSDGLNLTLRTLRRVDLIAALSFINDLVAERKTNHALGVLADTKQTMRSERHFIDNLVKGVKQNNVVNVAGFEGKRLIGNCEVRRERFKDSKHHGYLGIAIRRGYRGRGIGERMMRVLLRASREVGIKTVQLEVFESNANAIKLYKKLGFEKVGVIPKKVRRKEMVTDSIIMFAEI